MEDRSLEEFLDADSGDDSEDETQLSADNGVDDPDQADEVQPTAVTAEWTPAGRCCDCCGAETQRLWTDGDSTVCRSCKEW